MLSRSNSRVARPSTSSKCSFSRAYPGFQNGDGCSSRSEERQLWELSVFIQHICRPTQSEARRKDRCYLSMWWRKLNVLKWDLQTGNVLHWRMSCGSSFQSRGPDTEKRRSPRVVSVRGTDSESTLEERRPIYYRVRVGSCGFNMLVR